MKLSNQLLRLSYILLFLVISCKKKDDASCIDGIKNGTETAVDCGGPDCNPCSSSESCSDGIQNGNETAVDCGGSCPLCTVVPTCTDGIQNGNETGVDCGGSCPPCTVVPTCNDGLQNGNETGVDCGGSCPPCTVVPTCNDGIQNGNETGVDCGGSCPPCAFVCGTGTVSDIDGNTYSTVQIGNQCWTGENLNTTKLNNGTSIALISEVSSWNTSSPAWCEYGNSSANGETYGKLYNWHAAAIGNLCPAGWHVATDGEWWDMASYLGFNYAGSRLKPGGDTGFNGLFGGYRWQTGAYLDINTRGFFWTSTASSATDAKSRSLNSGGSVAGGDYLKTFGMSCRCVQD
ncbi:MAG: fibrobacter succinogenes major paralogous domain-containing protein [Bacteroidia bacterium]